MVGYAVISGNYPIENGCDSSIGRTESGGCSVDPAQSDWDQACDDPAGGDCSFINQNIVIDQAFLKSLPIDPINSVVYYYKYEPGPWDGAGGGNCDGSELCNYWVGVLSEALDDPNNPIFRCCDHPDMSRGPGCLMVPGNLDVDDGPLGGTWR